LITTKFDLDLQLLVNAVKALPEEMMNHGSWGKVSGKSNLRSERILQVAVRNSRF
jgi:hypothetical protein